MNKLHTALFVCGMLSISSVFADSQAKVAKVTERVTQVQADLNSNYAVPSPALPLPLSTPASKWEDYKSGTAIVDGSGASSGGTGLGDTGSESTGGTGGA